MSNAVSSASNAIRVGVYVDVTNISMNGGRGMRFDTLRRYATRDGAEVVRLNAYVAYDEERAKQDPRYREGTIDFFRILRDFGYKVVTKVVRWFVDENGDRHPRANVEFDLAVDVLLQSERLDRVILLTGDSDFVGVVRAMQNKGCRCEVIGFRNVSETLRQEADVFISGFLLPGLLPAQGPSDAQWGQVGSRVRGICYDWRADRGFGFLRFIKDVAATTGLWVTDTRQAGSAFDTAFVHASELEKAKIDPNELPSRDIVLEFELTAGKKEGFEAKNIVAVHRYNASM